MLEFQIIQNSNGEKKFLRESYIFISYHKFLYNNNTISGVFVVTFLKILINDIVD